MGCEGGVVLYDAEAIEAEFGPNVWAVTGFGRERCNPMVSIDGRLVLVGSFDTCKDYDWGDPLGACIAEAWRLDDQDALEVFCGVKPNTSLMEFDAAVARSSHHPFCRIMRLRVAAKVKVLAQVETWT